MIFANSFNDIPFQDFTEIVVIPINSSATYHRVKNRLSFIYIYDIQMKKDFIVGINHNDVDKNNADEIKNLKWPKKIYCYKKNILQDYDVDCLDIDMLFWLRYNIPIKLEYPTAIEKYHKWYYNLKHVNDIIPIVLFVDYCRNIVRKFVSTNIQDLDGISFYNSMLDNYRLIENNGIPINKEILKKYYDVDYNDNRFYTEYFTYTSTGRPSNTFNHINFAALNKTSGVRSMIIPSENSILIEFDYSSYHVNLISKLIGFEYDSENLHDYLGKIYFGSDALTEEQYIESKNITFRLINGVIPSEFLDIPFFKMVSIYRKNNWASFQKNGYIRMPLSNRKIFKVNLEEMNESKLMNYILQGYETELNSVILGDIHVYLYKKKSQLILYTYDSFLFNFHYDDGEDTLHEILKILMKFGMKVTMKVGKNYNDMKYRKLVNE